MWQHASGAPSASSKRFAMDYIIKNGTVVNEGCLTKRDLYIHEGRLVEREEMLRKPQTFEAGGCYVLPGVIDTATPDSLRRQISPPRARLLWREGLRR